MRLLLGKVLLIILCITAIFGFVYVDIKSEQDLTQQELAFSLGDEIIYAWQSEDMTYLFLPSYADMRDVKVAGFGQEFYVKESDTFYKRGDSLGAIPLNLALNCSKEGEEATFRFCVMKSENLPTMFIETDSGTLDNIRMDKMVEENGRVQVYDVNGELLYAGGLSSIKGRGNTSFINYEKKPLSITTKDVVSLLGLGAGQKYALLSNSSDTTLVRNDIARNMEAALETEYDNCGIFVDLYANGEYFGNYYLCETIEIGPERINITNLEAQMDTVYQHSNYASLEDYVTNVSKGKYMDVNPADITGGYLVEREYTERFQLEYNEIPSAFTTKAEEHFVVKSPLYCSDEQITYIASYFEEAETAILNRDGINEETGKAYDEYIDVESFAKKYLVEEVTKNYDAGVTSAFYYKDADAIDGRIKTGPVWDSDLTFGNGLEWMTDFSKDPEGISKLAFNGNKSTWFETLCEKEEFQRLVCTEYAQKVSPYLEELLANGIEQYETTLAASSKMNEIRWKIDFENNPDYKNRETAFAELKQFIEARKRYLDNEWVTEWNIE